MVLYSTLSHRRWLSLWGAWLCPTGYITGSVVVFGFVHFDFGFGRRAGSSFAAELRLHVHVYDYVLGGIV
jgi:hypothetical protein